MKPIDCIGPVGMAAVIRDLDPFQWAPRLTALVEPVRIRARLDECADCGGMHPTDSVYCPMRQHDDDGRDD